MQITSFLAMMPEAGPLAHAGWLTRGEFDACFAIEISGMMCNLTVEKFEELRSKTAALMWERHYYSLHNSEVYCIHGDKTQQAIKLAQCNLNFDIVMEDDLV